MSFSSSTKNEISLKYSKSLHCNIAELIAIMNICCENVTFHNKKYIIFHIDNLEVMKKCFTILQNSFNIIGEVSIKSFINNRSIKDNSNRHIAKLKSYTIIVRKQSDVFRLLEYKNDLEVTTDWHKNSILLGSQGSIKSYIRGTFLCNGSITDPNKNYHMEFVFTDLELANNFAQLFQVFDITPKIIFRQRTSKLSTYKDSNNIRKNHVVVYIKDSNHIADILKIIGASVALLEFENIRILKEMRNDINRKVNCETANINKVVNASVKQVEDILFIKNTIGIDSLPNNLREIAFLRLEYQDTSLKDLGTYLEVPVGKSGVNHRLKKLRIIADEIRKGNR